MPVDFPWYLHWARRYEEPPEDENDGEDDCYDDWHKEADCWMEGRR